MFARFVARPAEEERSFNPAAYGIDRDPFLTVFAGYRGPLVDRARAMRSGAVVACIRTLCNSVAKAPIDVLRVQSDRRIPIPQPAIVANPSGIVRAKVWRKQVVYSVLTDGNAFGHVARVDSAMRPTQIEILDPESVTNRKVDNGHPVVTIDGKERQLWPLGDVWHYPGQIIPAGTPFAISPMQCAADAIGTSLSAQSYGREFFTSGGHPTGIIYSAEEIDTNESAAIKKAFVRATAGREPAVFGKDLKYEQVQSTPNETGSIELLRWEIEEICRHFGVPPAMVYAQMSGQNITYANVTQFDLSYLKHTLDDHFDDFEDAYFELLPRPQIARFNRDAVLRSDPKSRAEIHALRLKTKTRTVNEVRALEDEAPFPDDIYDQPGIPGAPGAPDANPPGGA